MLVHPGRDKQGPRKVVAEAEQGDGLEPGIHSTRFGPQYVRLAKIRTLEEMEGRKGNDKICRRSAVSLTGCRWETFQSVYCRLHTYQKHGVLRASNLPTPVIEEARLRLNLLSGPVLCKSRNR